MTFVLKLTDGTTPIDFMSGTYRLEDGGLEFSSPRKKQVWSGDSLYNDGAQLIYSTFENRSVRIHHQIKAMTRDGVSDAINQIDRLLEAARKRSKEQDGPRVELQYSWNGSTQTAYFDVTDGETNWPANIMSVEQIHQTQNGEYILVGFETSLICQPFSYPVSPVSGTPTVVGLTNGNGTKVTSGLLVWNHDDSTTGHDDWVEIDGKDIPGAFACKLKLAIKRESGESEKASKIYIGVRKGNTGFKHILEDNAAEYVIGSPTPTSDPDYSSGGTYTIFSFTSTSGEQLIRWVLTETETTNTRGHFRIFGRTKEGYHWDSAANYRVVVLYGTDVLYRGEWRKPVNTTTELFDFGTLQMPPWLVGTSGDLVALKIALEGKRDTAGTSTIYLDYVSLLPQDGGYRILQMRTTGMAQFEYLIDDGWLREIYHLTTTSKKTGLPFGLMPQITLIPNQTVRLYFLVEGTSQNAEITRQLKIQAYLIPTYNVMV